MHHPAGFSLQLTGRASAFCSAAVVGGFCSLTHLAVTNKNIKLQKNHPPLPSPWILSTSSKKFFEIWCCSRYKPPVGTVITLSVSPNTTTPQLQEEILSANFLQQKFGTSKAVKFQQRSNMVMMELKAENGSTVRMLLPKGLITSYKPSMWHGGFEEMLHLEAQEVDGVQKVEGGIGLHFSYADREAGSILSEFNQIWEVEDISEDPVGTVKVMLICRISEHGKQDHDVLFFRYIVTLSQTMLASAIVVSNIGRSPVKFTGLVLSHVALSEIEGAYVVGLDGCTYSSVPTASEPTKNDSLFHRMVQIWSPKNQTEREDVNFPAQQLETDSLRVVPESTLKDRAVENEEYAGLSDGVKRLYTMLRDSCMLLDRGKRRSLVFRRMGFSDLWLCNPGHKSGRKDWDKFICIGPASFHQPVLLEPGREWRAAQIIENLNA